MRADIQIFSILDGIQLRTAHLAEVTGFFFWFDMFDSLRAFSCLVKQINQHNTLFGFMNAVSDSLKNQKKRIFVNKEAIRKIQQSIAEGKMNSEECTPIMENELSEEEEEERSHLSESVTSFDMEEIEITETKTQLVPQEEAINQNQLYSNSNLESKSGGNTSSSMKNSQSIEVEEYPMDDPELEQQIRNEYGNYLAVLNSIE